MRMQEVFQEDLHELSDEFDQVFNDVIKRPGNAYDFLIKAGSSLKPALKNLCKIAWETESLPESWSQSTLVQIYKGNGAINDLKNYRFEVFWQYNYEGC